MHVILPFLLAITGTAAAQASAQVPLSVQTQAVEALLDCDAPQFTCLGGGFGR